MKVIIAGGALAAAGAAIAGLGYLSYLFVDISTLGDERENYYAANGWMIGGGAFFGAGVVTVLSGVGMLIAERRRRLELSPMIGPQGGSVSLRASF